MFGTRTEVEISIIPIMIIATNAVDKIVIYQ
jgi:hypothetical protein